MQQIHFRRIEYDFSHLNDLLNSLNSCKNQRVCILSPEMEGLEMEAVVLHRGGILAYFCSKQGQDFNPIPKQACLKHEMPK